MGTLCLWKNKGPTLYDTIGTHDFKENNIAATFIELLQKLTLSNFS